MSDDRVRIVIEIPKVDLPVVALAITYGEMMMSERAPPFAYRIVKRISDGLTMAFTGVDADDVDDMELDELFSHAIKSMARSMQGGPGSFDLDERVDVTVEEIE